MPFINLNMKYLILLLALLAITFTLSPRKLAPDFVAQAVLPDLSFKTIKLTDYVGKYVVLLFYPFDFTYVCPTEITSYSDQIHNFRGILINR